MSPSRNPPAKDPRRENYPNENANLARHKGVQLLDACGSYLREPDREDAPRDWSAELVAIDGLQAELADLDEALGLLKWNDRVPTSVLAVFERVEQCAMGIQTSTHADETEVRIGKKLLEFRSA